MATNVSRKKPNFGNTRSHAKNQGNKIQKTNLQKVTIDGNKVEITAREKRTLEKGNK